MSATRTSSVRAVRGPTECRAGWVAGLPPAFSHILPPPRSIAECTLSWHCTMLCALILRSTARSSDLARYSQDFGSHKHSLAVAHQYPNFLSRTTRSPSYYAADNGCTSPQRLLCQHLLRTYTQPLRSPRHSPTATHSIRIVADFNSFEYSQLLSCLFPAPIRYTTRTSNFPSFE